MKSRLLLQEQEIQTSIVNNVRVIKGIGQAICHHGELLQGIFEVKHGLSVRGLVTLPCEIYEATAYFVLNENEEIKVYPDYKKKALRAVQLTLKTLGFDKKVGGTLYIKSNIPLGYGFGSSTSDVIASIKAVLNTFNLTLPKEIVSFISVQAERASDSILYDTTDVLYAHRQGIVVRDFNGKIPLINVLGFNTNHKGVDTLGCPLPEYTLEERKEFNTLLNQMEAAISLQDVTLLADVATKSAIINQKYLKNDLFLEVLDIVHQVGAKGVQIAHSGTIVGVIFDYYDKDKVSKVNKVKEILLKYGISDCWFFKYGNEDP